MTLQEIFNYANQLAENNFHEMGDALGFLNEAQDIISRFDPMQAQPFYTIVTDQGIGLPTNLLRVSRITSGGKEYRPKEEAWNNVLPTPDLPVGSQVKVFYYSKPAELSEMTVLQEPRVPKQYHRAMAHYAAKMFYLVDDDPPLRDAFKQEFMSLLGSLKSGQSTITNFYNYW